MKIKLSAQTRIATSSKRNGKRAANWYVIICRDKNNEFQLILSPSRADFELCVPSLLSRTGGRTKKLLSDILHMSL